LFENDLNIPVQIEYFDSTSIFKLRTYVRIIVYLSEREDIELGCLRVHKLNR